MFIKTEEDSLSGLANIPASTASTATEDVGAFLKSETEADGPISSGPPLSNTKVPSVEEWSKNDETLAGLFHGWDELQTKRVEDDLAYLRELDCLLYAFEEHIGHTDQGFDKWVNRHQKAMERGWASPNDRYYNGRTSNGAEFRELIARGWRPVWRTTKWQYRYTWLVQQRQIWVRQRLEQMGMKPEGKSFFGKALQTPQRRRIWAKSMKNPVRLEKDWWWPLVMLLKRLAKKIEMDEGLLYRQFWRI